MKFPWNRAKEPATRFAASGSAQNFSVGINDVPWLASNNTSWAASSTWASRDQALSVPAVLKGRNLICGTIGSLPFYTVDADNNRIRLPLTEQIDPNVPNSVTMAMTVEDLLFYGTAWWHILNRGYDGYPTSAEHVYYGNVSWQMPSGYPLDKLPSGYYPGSHVFVLGEPIPATDMLRFDSPNPPLLLSGGRSILRALKLEAAADLYANDPQAREYFSAADGSDPDDDDVTSMLNGWLAARQSRTTAYIPSGFTLNQIQQPTPADLQLAQIQREATLAIANAMGLDPEDLGVSTTSRTYRNAVDRRQDRLNECYGPFAQAIEDRLSMGDITRRGQRVCFDWDDFLKANPLERAQTQAIWLANKVVTPDEVRNEEDMPPMTAQQKASIKPAPVPTPVEPSPVDNAPVQQASYSSGDAAGFVFDMDGLDQAFSVDLERRTITGMVAPFGRIGMTAGKKWMFTAGSLKYAPSQINRIKLLQDHDGDQPVGFLAKTWATPEGQFGTFKVGRGPAGDAALQSAADGVRDGLSVGVGHAGDDSGFTFSDQDGVNVITSAPWRETSLVALPAFQDARTTAVTMSAAIHQGDNMPEQQEAAPVAAQFDSAALALAVKDAVAAEFAAREVKEGPAKVEAQPKVPAQVNEAPLYRFDGGKAQRVFTADLAKAANGDFEAKSTLERYMGEHMGAQFANITPANVAALNPVLTRPELYVPNLSFPRPLGDLVTTGGLTDLIAFIAPKYSSSSGLVGDHTTGTEPTDGAFSATTQTITPKGLSGRVDVDREVIDSGGSPQADMLIYSEMVRAYNEVLEKRIVAAFVALSLTDTPVVGIDGDLQAGLVGAGGVLTNLQYLRGGDRFTALALDSTLYGAIVGANDGQGRPLFPMGNPMNVNGVTAGDMSSVQVGGHRGVPSWACETGNGGAQRSYLFAPRSVYQWNSAPQRFTFNQVNVSTVGIAIWGYSAEAITRTSDVYQLAYTVS
nr:hypothetical protein Hi04_10k_c361_00019 [uncultured bacterium]